MMKRLVLFCLGLCSSLFLLVGCHDRQKPCGLSEAPCSAKGTLEHGGDSRTYLYKLSPGLRPGAPLVLLLHGRMDDGVGMRRAFSLNWLTPEGGYITVFPDGVRRSWADGRGTERAEAQGVDDVGFLTALVDELVRRFEADPRRVYVVGMDNGGMMAYRLACERADRFAAIATMGTLMPEWLLSHCAPSRPVSVLAFSGTEDPRMPFGGLVTEGGRGNLLSAEKSRQTWAGLNGCSEAPVITWEPHKFPHDETRARREVHTGCREGSEVDLYVIEGGGHTWPGIWDYMNERRIGRGSRDVSSPEVVWKFFQSHPR